MVYNFHANEIRPWVADDFEERLSDRWTIGGLIAMERLRLPHQQTFQWKLCIWRGFCRRSLWGSPVLLGGDPRVGLASVLGGRRSGPQ